MVGAGVSLWALTALPHTHPDWLMGATFLVLATSAQLFKAEAPNHTVFYASPVLFFAGVLRLPPALIVLLIALPHLVEWARERWRRSAHLAAWYLQPFNIAMYCLAGLSAHEVYVALDPHRASTLTPLPLMATGLAALTYAVVNHTLLGQALVLARQVSWRDSGVLALDNIVADLVLLCLGGVVAVLWQVNPWFLVLALSPLILMYRALMIPQLEQEARSDVKTGLWNARHFNTLFAAELGRAQRFRRPLGVIMADLDLMRDINNTYGHLAGDIVLAGIGHAIRASIREYDIAGRFGGEEFAIILLETEPEHVQMVAERIRRAVEAARFAVPTSPTPIGATMSIGVACFPEDGATLTELTHAADVAVYQAKAQGRNRVICARDVIDQGAHGAMATAPIAPVLAAAPTNPPATMTAAVPDQSLVYRRP